MMAIGIVPYGPNGRFEVQDKGRRVAVFDMLADAELFIAAPRLLAALELGIAYAKEHQPHLYDDDGWAQHEAFLAEARAVVKATRGEE